MTSTNPVLGRISRRTGGLRRSCFTNEKDEHEASSAVGTAAVGIFANRVHRTDPVFMSGPDGGYVAAVAQGSLLVFMSG